MKTRQENDVIDHKGVISVEYDTELSRLIGQCVVYDEDKTGQQHDWSYRWLLLGIDQREVINVPFIAGRWHVARA